MEETHFIKCEPAWSEESFDSESHVQSAVNNLPEVKPDPDGSWEEANSTLVSKEESGIPVVSREDCNDPGVLLNESLLINLAGTGDPLSSKMDPPTLNDQEDSSQIQRLSVSQSSVDTNGEERFCACGKVFASCRHTSLKPTRKKNVDKLPSADKKAFTCPFCERAYSYRSDFDMHMRSHTGHKPHTCPTCGKAFSKRSNMKQHMVLHTGDRPYSCPTCSRAFRKRAHLNDHVLVHTGEKPYVCTVCGRRFTHRASLRNHRVLHVGSYPYQCDICKRAFNYKSRLNRHMQSHIVVETHL